MNRRKKLIQETFLKRFLFAFLLAALGFAMANFLNAFYPLSRLQIRSFQIFTIALEAIAFGQYIRQTWIEDYPTDKKTFSCFSSISFLLLICSIQLKIFQIA